MHRLGIALVVVSWTLVAHAAQAADRVALIVGNAKYEGYATLRSPGNDADAMADALEALHFKVLKKNDLPLARMEESLSEFRRMLHKGCLALFFYSGHGIQAHGENYLVPIDARMHVESEVKRKCLAVSQVLDAMRKSESSLKVVILDCCRDNPLQYSWTRGMSHDGLVPVSNVPEGTLIAFATAPNATASDGSGNNSPYTEQLVAALRSRPADGLELSEVFRAASRAVKRQTGQVPWLNLEASLENYFLTPKTIANSLGMQLVFIPAGEFMMGNGHTPEEEVALCAKYHIDITAEVFRNEYPRHPVRISKAFISAQRTSPGASSAASSTAPATRPMPKRAVGRGRSGSTP